MTHYFILLVWLVCLASCTNDKKQDQASTSKDTARVTDIHSVNESPVAIENYFESASDSITIAPFDIEVSLSPKAAARMKKGGETIIVDVAFTGTPKPNVNAKLEEDGSFFVATAQKEITNWQIASFKGLKFSRKIYDQLADKNIDLGVNVYSGRKSSPDNLLPVMDSLIRLVMSRIRSMSSNAG